MSGRAVAAVACLVAGVGLAAWSLANRQLLFAIGGFALIFTFIYLVLEAMTKASKPTHEYKRSATPAWSMKDDAADQARGNDGEDKR